MSRTRNMWSLTFYLGRALLPPAAQPGTLLSPASSVELGSILNTAWAGGIYSEGIGGRRSVNGKSLRGNIRGEGPPG